MTRKNKDVNQAAKAAPESPDQELETCYSQRRQETRLEIPVGARDVAALRTVTREWLVPRLVEEFLRERGIELRAARKPIQEKHQFQWIDKRRSRV